MPKGTARGTTGPLIDYFKIAKDVAESLEKVPYVKSIAGILAQLLEIREASAPGASQLSSSNGYPPQQLVSNKETARELIDNVHHRSQDLFSVLERYVENSASREADEMQKTLKPLERDLLRYKKLLEDVYDTFKTLTSSMRGALHVFRRRSVKEELDTLQRRLTEFDHTFQFTQLSHVRLDIAGVASRMNSLPLNIPKRERVLVVPSPPSRLFVGRRNILDHMLEAIFSDVSAFNGQKCYVLHGLGGAGKTQLGLKFISENNKRFTRKYFIDASSTERINTHLEDIGLEAKISESPQATDTLSWLQSLDEDWLLFFDNADDPEIDLRPFFPPCDHGNIIITSRNPDCTIHAFPTHASWKVSDLTPEDAVSLLLASSRRNGEDDVSNAPIVVEELGYLALAIIQAGSFIASNPGVSLQKYLELYRSSRNELLRTGPKQRLDGYAHTVYTTWEISFQKLSPVAQTFLQMCGFLHHEGIATEIFSVAVANLRKKPDEAEVAYQKVGAEFLKHFTTADGGWDSIAFLRVVNDLSSYSLLQVNAQQVLNIHQLVHAWSKDRLTKEEKKKPSDLARALISLSANYDQDLASFAHRRVVFLHLDASLPDNKEELDTDLAFRYVEAYELEGRWKSVQSMSEIAIRGSVAKYGEEDAKTLKTRLRLASALEEQGYLAEAESIGLDVLKIRKRVLGDEDPATFIAMNNLGVTLVLQERYDEARTLVEQLLELRKRVLGPEHSDTVYSMVNLGAIFNRLQRYDEAASLESQALALRQHVLSAEHPDTLVGMINLSSTYGMLGRYSEAEELAVEAMKAFQRNLGETHPQTLMSMTHVAWVYQQQGRIEEADGLMKNVADLEPARKW